MADSIRPSRASEELDKILDERGPRYKALRGKLDRAHLWRLRSGRRVASVKTAKLIRKLTKGAIPIEWWDNEAEAA